MRYKPNTEEMKSVLNSDLDSRVRYFVHKVADWESFWLVCDSEGNLFGGYDSNDRECISVWPFKEYADLVLADSKNKDKLTEMTINKFLDEYVDELTKKNISIIIFPDKKLHGAIMAADVFKNIMKAELAKYGD